MFMWRHIGAWRHVEYFPLAAYVSPRYIDRRRDNISQISGVRTMLSEHFLVFGSVHTGSTHNVARHYVVPYVNRALLIRLNHSLNFVDPNTGAHTQKIERSWKAAKERNKRHNREPTRQMLYSYMCEFMWRNRVKVRQLNAFDTILQDIAVFWPPV